ncbi:hypothetical protein AMJ85_11100 [candidate division BRC1 bacterium SM23_51]|nr:MAG: hypothetical protein AMJ85_11100 [candidate division BRC1 bacterium SM23_51]
MGEPARVLDVPAGDVSTLLAGMSQKKVTTSKSKVPIVSGHEEIADQAVEKKRTFKQAETEWKMAEEQVLQEASAIYGNRAKAGNFSKSLNFAGRETAGVQVRFSDKFSVLPAETKNTLTETLGERYGQTFEEVRTLTLKQEKTDDESIRFLLERLGPEVFAQFFEVEVQVKPKPGFDRAQFDMPDSVRPLFRQAKPSVTLL